MISIPSALFQALYVPHPPQKIVFGFPTRCDSNLAVQPQKMTKGLKFRMKEEERSHYICSENKGANQLGSYCAADLRISEKQLFS